MTTTDVVGWLVADRGNPIFLFQDGGTDGTKAEIKQNDPSKSIGDALGGRTIKTIALQASDGSVLDEVQVKNDAGGLVLSTFGKERTISGSAWNFILGGISMLTKAGYTMYVDTAD